MAVASSSASATNLLSSSLVEEADEDEDDEEDKEEEEEDVGMRTDLESVAIMLLESGAKLTPKYDWLGRLPVSSEGSSAVIEATAASKASQESEDCFGWKRMWTEQTPRLLQLIGAAPRLQLEEERDAGAIAIAEDSNGQLTKPEVERKCGGSNAGGVKLPVL